MLDILETVESWLKEGRKIALATVVETWGSAPRGVGSKMAVTDDTAMIGSVSGGCVEVAVIEEAVEILTDGKPRLLKYGVSDDSAWEVGLTCGGKIAVFVEPLDAEWWRLATDYTQHDRAAATITVLEGDHAGEKMLINGEGVVQYSTFTLDTAPIASIAAPYTAPQRADINGLSVMVDVHRPRPHLIIVGGVHVAQPLQSFARTLGFRVSLIDPRGAFASHERFRDISTILHSYPDKALKQLGLDAHTYLAVLTHDPKIDDGALIAALPSPAPYIGVLSSRKTHQARVERLREAGISDELISRIRTPIGIEIDAHTPEEIALSIMAEIIATRNRVMAAQPAAQNRQAAP